MLAAVASLPLPARLRTRCDARSGLGDDLNLDYLLKGANNTGLIDQYIRDNPEETADWDVLREDRGNFVSPSGRTVPLGTSAVREEINRIKRHGIGLSHEHSDGWKLTVPKGGPDDDYAAVLYIEKAGFTNKLDEAGLLRRRDLAVASSRGFSVRACRSLLDFLRSRDVPVLVVHDFDKAGLGIAAAILREIPDAIDLGLRWEDLIDRRWGHADSDLRHRDYSERVTYTIKQKPYDPRQNLIENKATANEIRFLCSTARPGVEFSGRRIELNALVGDEFVDWLDGKLSDLDLDRVIPDADYLEQAYRRTFRLARLNLEEAKVWDAARDEADAIAVPGNLLTLVRDGLEAFEEQAWDDVVVTLVSDHLTSLNGGRR
jgi:hypothetical protein